MDVPLVHERMDQSYVDSPFGCRTPNREPIASLLLQLLHARIRIDIRDDHRRLSRLSDLRRWLLVRVVSRWRRRVGRELRSEGVRGGRRSSSGGDVRRVG